MGCIPWGRAESDTTYRFHFHFSLSCIGEGNGNPLQCSCLENPRDGAWWVAIYGVAQSRTRLKRLSSSSSMINISLKQSHLLTSIFYLLIPILHHFPNSLPSTRNIFLPLHQSVQYIYFLQWPFETKRLHSLLNSQSEHSLKASLCVLIHTTLDFLVAFVCLFLNNQV